MSKGWFVVIVITVALLVFWTALEIYGVFRKEEPETQYSSLITPISRELPTEVVENVYDKQNLVLVKKDQIEPK